MDKARIPGVVITIRHAEGEPTVLRYPPESARSRGIRVTAFPDGDLTVGRRFGRILKRYARGEWTGYSYDLMKRRHDDV